MFRNYLKTALRNLSRNKIYSVINITGFAIGLAVSIMILFYVKHELTYDHFHPHKDQIYRLAFTTSNDKTIEQEAALVPVAGPETADKFPEIKSCVRLSGYHGGTLARQEKVFREEKIRYADSSLFAVFGFRLAEGNPQTALSGPNKIVLTRELADKIFGEENPLGKTLNYSNKADMVVSGIMAPVNGQSHIRFSALVSFESAYNFHGGDHFSWKGGMDYYTYFLFKTGTPAPAFQMKLDQFVYDKIGYLFEQHGWSIDPWLQPIEDIYLHHGGMDDPASRGNLRNIYIFSIIALFLLVIAGINFMNLSIAQSIKRIGEVGIRKVAGASRKKLIVQFIGESLVVTFTSLILALILIEVFLPHFNQLIGKDLSMYVPANADILLAIPLLVFLVGLASGSYPAFFVSSFGTSAILRSRAKGPKKKLTLSNALIIVQFIISIGLIIGSLVVYNQLSYMQNKDLGYNKENLLSISLDSKKALQKSTLLKEQFTRLPGIENVSLASDYPGKANKSAGFLPEGSEQAKMYSVIYVDPDFIETLNLKIVDGRNFENGRQTDKQAYLVNEALCRELGWEQPVGKTIMRNGHYPIIGVVQDFHFAALHQEIEPLIFAPQPGWESKKALIRLEGHQTKESLAGIQSVWKEMMGNEPLRYEFLDDTFQSIYSVDIRFGEIILSFTILAIFIACLGLFGLTAFFTAQRTKEIGIRKAMGASITNINAMIIKQYTRWVLIANLVAWPLAWYAMRNWLDHYAYHIHFHIGYFVLAAAMALALTIATLSYQSIKTANINPADSLRHE